jgi:hypothetical protein
MQFSGPTPSLFFLCVKHVWGELDMQNTDHNNTKNK